MMAVYHPTVPTAMQLQLSLPGLGGCLALTEATPLRLTSTDIGRIVGERGVALDHYRTFGCRDST